MSAGGCSSPGRVLEELTWLAAVCGMWPTSSILRMVSSEAREERTVGSCRSLQNRVRSAGRVELRHGLFFLQVSLSCVEPLPSDAQSLVDLAGSFLSLLHLMASTHHDFA